MKIVYVLVASVLVSACLPTTGTDGPFRTETDFKVVTAEDIDIDPQSITISDVTGGLARTALGAWYVDGPYRWRAGTPQGDYNCEGDVNLTRVLCIRAE